MDASEILKNVGNNMGAVVIIWKILHEKYKKYAEKRQLDAARYLPARDHYIEYLSRTYGNLSIVNTLYSKNISYKTKDIYEPLEVFWHDPFGKKIKHTISNDKPFSLLSKFNKLVIQGAAGSGKSVVLKMLFLDIVDRSMGVPVYIELRRLSSSHKIFDEFLSQITPDGTSLNKEILWDCIGDGDFIFLFDGYDEIQPSQISQVNDDLKDFCSRCSKNKFVITSRPRPGLNIKGFNTVFFENIDYDQCCRIIKKYDSQGAICEKLIKEVKDFKFLEGENLLLSPLMAYFLYVFSLKGKSLPSKKHVFFRTFFDMLFSDHDELKGCPKTFKSLLSRDQFHSVLRELGFIAFKEQKIEFSKEEILLFIRRSLDKLGYSEISESDVLGDLFNDIPIFVSNDDFYFKWSHRSIQEYFAACYIFRCEYGEKASVLRNCFLSNPQSNIDMIDIYCDMDPVVFRETFVYEYLKKYRQYHFMRPDDIPAELEQEVSFRKEILFVWKLFLSFFITEGGLFNPDNFYYFCLDCSRRFKVKIYGATGRYVSIGGFDSMLLISRSFDNLYHVTDFLFKRGFSWVEKISRADPFPTSLSMSPPSEIERLSDLPDLTATINNSQNFADINKVIKFGMHGLYKINSRAVFSEIINIENSLKTKGVQ